MPSIYLSASTQESNLGTDKITEEARMQELAAVVADLLRRSGLTVYLNDPAWGVNQIIADSDKKKPNLHLALHSNAGGDTGTETWVYGLKLTDSSQFGTLIQKAVVAVLGLKDRGLKDGTAPGQIIGEVKNTSATAVLIELFFHDSPSDLVRYKERKKAVAEAIARAVCQWFGVLYAENMDEIEKLREENRIYKSKLSKIEGLAKLV